LLTFVNFIAPGTGSAFPITDPDPGERNQCGSGSETLWTGMQFRQLTKESKKKLGPSAIQGLNFTISAWAMGISIVTPKKQKGLFG
jgi:hypothetical protein